ncbi:UNVERIFIED_CONTAM: hypothetical protein Sradi_2370400 [Sesamum radiatum]|uniref:Transposase-associated domain-containing protein n=1 Tax=Sesamum radiatum TaxID=300843 RepID=A0AAW2T962_SESRA
MYEKNLPNRAGLTPEFEDGVTAFIEWAKSQHAYMEGEKIKCPCRKCKNKVFKTPDKDGAPDDGTRSYNTDVGPSSYYGKTPYGYESGLAYRFHNIVHAAEQLLQNGCTQSQLGVVAELVDIKDDIDLDYCKFCEEARYKPTRERNPNCKKIPYAILRYLPLTPRLQRLCASKATAEQIMWHANHQTKEGSIWHPSDVEAWRHFDPTYLDFAAEHRNVRLAFDRGVAEFMACGYTDAGQCEERGLHDAHGVDVDLQRPTRLWDGFWME